MTWAHDDIMAGILEHRRHMAKSAPSTIGVIYSAILTDCAMKKSPRNRHKTPFLPLPVENAFNRLAVDCLGLSHSQMLEIAMWLSLRNISLNGLMLQLLLVFLLITSSQHMALLEPYCQIKELTFCRCLFDQSVTSLTQRK